MVNFYRIARAHTCAFGDEGSQLI